MIDQFPKKPGGLKPAKTYDFIQVHNQLKKNYQTVIARLEKEAQVPPTYFFITNLLKFSFQTYRVTTRLVADTAEEKFPLQAHILSRSIIDALYTVVALLDDPSNTRRYEVAGFRKFWESYKKEENETYVDSPEFKAMFASKKEEMVKLAKSLKLTSEEEANPRKILHWPLPSQMIKEKDSPIPLSPKRMEFLREIYKWHYTEPSGVVHGDWIGIVMTVFASHPEKHWEPGKYESDAVYIGILFLLIMLSEVEISKSYGCKEDLQSLWKILGEVNWEVNEYYKMRYEELLTTS